MKQFKAHALHGTVQELWTQFHKYVRRIMLANTEPQAEFLQKKMVMWLHEMKQPHAANWFETYWTGRRGRWHMLDIPMCIPTAVSRVTLISAKTIGLVRPETVLKI